MTEDDRPLTEEERRAEEIDFVQGVVEIADAVRDKPDDPAEFPTLSEYGQELLDTMRKRMLKEEFH